MDRPASRTPANESPRAQDLRLVGERVVLRPVRRADALVAYELVHDRPEILRWLLWRGPVGVEELEASFASWSDPPEGQARGDPADRFLAITDQGGERFVGTIAARFTGHPGMGDLGYWLGEHVWGRGYATEAIGLLTRHCFEQLATQSLFAWVFVGNEGSRRALEKNGFSLVRTERERMEQDGIARDEWYLTLLRSEWLRRRAAAARPSAGDRREPLG